MPDRPTVAELGNTNGGPTGRRGSAPPRVCARGPQEAPAATPPQAGAAGSINEGSAAPGFAAFAQAYPKKTGMSAARAAFTEACNVADPDYIVARAKLYAKDFEGERARYAIPPKQWLHESWFNDPLPDGVTIDNDTGELVFIHKPRHRNGGETWDEKIARLQAEYDEENADGAIH